MPRPETAGQGKELPKDLTTLWATPTALLHDVPWLVACITCMESQKNAGDGTATQARRIQNLKEGYINPDWVEVLMGFPLGWTDSECDNPKLMMPFPAGRGIYQYNWEPERLVSKDDKQVNHNKRLKALGNAVVPVQFAWVFKAIKELEQLERSSSSR